MINITYYLASYKNTPLFWNIGFKRPYSAKKATESYCFSLLLPLNLYDY